METRYQPKYLSASILPSVLVICTLMALIVMGFFLLWDTSMQHIAGYHYQRQQQLHVESGYLLYSTDSVAAEAMVSDSLYLLFPEERRSEISVGRRPWGAYEIVTIIPGEKKCTSIRLLGKAAPGPENAALWICNRHKSLLLSGNTRITGKAWLPDNGIQYAQIESHFFNGTKLEQQQIKVSKETLPALNNRWKEYVAALQQTPENPVPLETLPSSHSFREPALSGWTDGVLTDIAIRGNIILYADRLYIGAGCKLNDILLFASTVEIESGFRGNLQIFARDSVILHEHTYLEYPSGICLYGNASGAFIGLGRESVVNGYVILENGIGTQGRMTPDYLQHPTARVRGLLWINGLAQLQGVVTGSAWLRDSYFFSPRGYYAGILYDVAILGDDRIAYPLPMEGAYERRCIKWLY